MKNILSRHKLASQNDFSLGFTLIELLVSTALLALVSAIGISIIFAAQSYYKRISYTRKLTDNLNVVMETMTREVKFGTQYACLAEGGAHFKKGRANNFKNSPSYNSFALPTQTDSTDNCTALAFIPEDKSASSTVFYFDFGTDTGGGSLNRVDYFCPSSGACSQKKDYPLTADGLKIDEFRVKVSGSKTTPGDDRQPGISLFLSGVITASTTNDNRPNKFSLQTFISQRILDK